MSQAMVAKADAVINQFKALVGFQGSPFHKNSRVLDRRTDGRHISEPTLDQDLIAFIGTGKDRFHVTLAGEHAKKAFAVLKKLNETYKPTYGSDPAEVKAANLCPDFAVLEKAADGTVILKILTALWNDFLKAMEMAGTKVQETDLTPLTQAA